MHALTRREWAFLALVFVFSFIPTVGGLFRIPELLGGPALMPVNPRAVLDPLPIVVHILGSFLFCLVGAVQFLPSVRRHRSGLHRALGRIVAAAGCVCALTGLWMTLVYVFPHALQGPLLYTVRIGVSLAMAALIVWAVVAIRLREVAGHRAAMLRAYSIGQGASTQTVLFLAVWAVFGAEPLGLPRDVLMAFAWALNLGVAEFLIRRPEALRATHAATAHPL